MDLSFSKVGNAYVATFDAGANFNLHVERTSAGYLRVEQRTTSNGNYSVVKEMGDYSFMKVIDVDFSGDIFPKSIKVVSETMPTMAVVTFKA